MKTLELKMSNKVTLAVLADLRSITTYVLLEQETWFEKELLFIRKWLKPGMTVIDIGANAGVYALSMAHRIGQNGRVFAYEPGSEARALLERSRELNAAANLHVLPFALSDCIREGHLMHRGSSELHALGDEGVGETVHITTLDSEEAVHGWPSPDFIKIDAEGEEERIVTGGRQFFARHSPLVMFEVRAGRTVNERLKALFPAIGYQVFRQLGGAPILIPDDPKQPLDGRELNLFAAKPDRATSMVQQGFLVESLPTWRPAKRDRQNAELFWSRQTFARDSGLARLVNGGTTVPPDSGYLDGLAAYAAWRGADTPTSTRCSALEFAFQSVMSAVARRRTAARLSAAARIAWEWGAWGESIAALRDLFITVQGGAVQIDEPFWPASPRFDNIAPGRRLADWFVGSAADQFEKAFSFSSTFIGRSSPMLTWLCNQSFASAEMERRRVLLAAIAGHRPNVPMRLRNAAADHLNANIWRRGQVPGTIVET